MFYILADKIFGGQNFSVDIIFGSQSDFRQFCPPKFCLKVVWSFPTGFATPTSDRSDVSYTFFYNKCQVDPSYQRIASSSPHQYNFKVEAFKFIRLSKSVYIHCRLAVCKSNSTSPTCTQGGWFVRVPRGGSFFTLHTRPGAFGPGYETFDRWLTGVRNICHS